MALATASSAGQPAVRTVLYKGIVRGGLSFYSNYESPKALQLESNPQAALLFLWTPLNRQMRISGRTDKLTRQESEKYFAGRPRLSQIGAWASDQSQPISAYAELEEKVQALEKKFAGLEIPCPPRWGGFRLLPEYFEFWFGKEGRLHERYVYEKVPGSDAEKPKWKTYLLSP